MQWPILNGIYTDQDGDFRTSLPKNLVPVPKSTGVSQGYLRPAEGIALYTSGPGIDRGGINWNGRHFRIMGEKLVEIYRDGTVSEFGTTFPVGFGSVAGDTGQVKLDYSFDYLGIRADRRLFLFNGSFVSEVTDTSLGQVIDFIWIDGYFMTTDGESLLVTEQSDPFVVDGTKYLSTFFDPDPVVALLKVRNEAVALSRHTVETFANVGGTGFPFAPVPGARINKGCIGTNACCNLLEMVVFLGGGRNEQIGAYIMVNGQYRKISTREIDQIFASYSEAALSTVVCESRVFEGHEYVYFHLPDQTLVYDNAATQAMSVPVWFQLTSGQQPGKNLYRARNFVYVFDNWYCGDPAPIDPTLAEGNALIGRMTHSVGSHYNLKQIAWEFETSLLYNESNAAIVNEIELIALSGRQATGDTPKIWTQYSLDGMTWSQKKYIDSGTVGDREKRLAWRKQGPIRHWRSQRFGGDSDSHLSIARLELQVEPLAHGR